MWLLYTNTPRHSVHWSLLRDIDSVCLDKGTTVNDRWWWCFKSKKEAAAARELLRNLNRGRMMRTYLKKVVHTV